MTRTFKVSIWRTEGGYSVCDEDGCELAHLRPDPDGSGWWTCVFANGQKRRPYERYEQPDGADVVEKLAVRLLRRNVP